MGEVVNVTSSSLHPFTSSPFDTFTLAEGRNARYFPKKF